MEAESQHVFAKTEHNRQDTPLLFWHPRYCVLVERAKGGHKNTNQIVGALCVANGRSSRACAMTARQLDGRVALVTGTVDSSREPLRALDGTTVMR